MIETTQPSRRMDRLQSIRTVTVKKQRAKSVKAIVLWSIIIAYFIAPFRTNILFLGTDDSPERGSLGRTDTIILASVVPFKPYIGLLSIPRDLWVNIPDVGEQRINTAYFYSEAHHAGSGADAAVSTIRANFDVPVRYYVLIHMDGLISLIDALGGVDVTLESPTGSLLAGTHHLNGIQTLLFVRDRSMSDDFGRMVGTQTLIAAMIQKAIRPSSWHALPDAISVLARSVDTNIPLWQAPRLAFVLIRAPLFGFDNRTITRDMVIPFTTSGGAQVLLPDWEAINPMLKEMFGN